MGDYRGFSIRDAPRNSPPAAPEATSAPPGSWLELWNALRHPREHFSLAVLLEAFVLVLGLAGTVYALAFRTFFLGSGVLVASVVGPCFAIVVASRGLRTQGVGFERFFVGLASAVSGIWLFEILYHYGWNGTFHALATNLMTFNIDTGLGNYFPLPWALIMVALPAVAYRRMRVNVVFILLLLGTLLGFWAWANAGYPQFTYVGSTAAEGAAYNTITKLFVCLLPASLFVPFGRIGILREARPAPGDTPRQGPVSPIPRRSPSADRRGFA